MFIRIMIMALTWTVPAMVMSQINFISNPGFEDSVHVGWRLNAWGGTAAELSNETGAYVISGNISAKVVVTTPDAERIEKVSLMTLAISNVPQDDELLVTAFAQTQTLINAPFKLSLKCVSASGDKKWYGGDEVTLTTSPQKFSFIVSPANEYRDTIFVRLSCGKMAGTYIFDNVSFQSHENITVPVPDGRRLREIVADKYPHHNVYIGGASQSRYWGTASEVILQREFSYITPANDFKQTSIHPEPGVWKWDDSDAWVQKAAENGQVIRMHSPISPQCSKWAKDDSRTPEELLHNLEEYVTALCKRYNQYDHILWMDVVNETIDKTTGAWFGPKPGTDDWENPWTIIGYDTTVSLKPPLYIKRAFELANQYAPNIKLIINQHGTMNDAAWDKVKQLVFYLRDKGLRVDGIGFQAHVDVGWEKEVNDSGVNNIVALEALIDWAHAHDLEFHITENTVYLRNGNEGKWQEQAQTFAAIVKTVLSKKETGVVTWNVWMIRDSDGKASDRTPVLFREDGSAKPAYYAVQSVLEDTTLSSVRKYGAIYPNDFTFFNNFPNPFNPSTTFTFTMPVAAHVSIIIYDILGKRIKVLIDEFSAPGQYKLQWDGTNMHNKMVSSGVYFAILTTDKVVRVKKLMLLH